MKEQEEKYQQLMLNYNRNQSELRDKELFIQSLTREREDLINKV